jgi:hypothetical protein
MDGISSPRSHDNDSLCLPPDTKARSGGAEKESPDLRRSRAFQPYDRPSSNEYHNIRRTNALTAVEVYQPRIPNFCQSSASYGQNLHKPSMNWPFGRASQTDNSLIYDCYFLRAGMAINAR